MQGDEHGQSFGGRLARGAVLLFSGTVAAFLILNSGPGCDGPKTEATKPAPTSAQAPAQQATQAAAPAQPTPAPSQPAQPTPAQVEPAPVPADSKIGPGTDGLVRPNAANNAGNADAGSPRYFPASKAGVFIEPAPQPVPPASEPAVQQNAPPPAQQQKGSK